MGPWFAIQIPILWYDTLHISPTSHYLSTQEVLEEEKKNSKGGQHVKF